MSIHIAGLVFQHTGGVLPSESVEGDHHCNTRRSSSLRKKNVYEVPRSCRNAAGLKVAAAVMSRVFAAFFTSLCSCTAYLEPHGKAQPCSCRAVSLLACQALILGIRAMEVSFSKALCLFSV